MISLQFGLPLVRCEKGKAVALDTGWLRTTVLKAALHAGYQGWWQADDVVEGITSYLRYDYTGTVIDLTRLEKAVRTVLCGVGYKEVAKCFYTGTPFPRISLVECLRQVSRNDRRAFFERLAEQIARLHANQTPQVHFSDLHACVRGLKRIHSPAHCTSDDQRLLRQIVGFVQDNVQSLPWQSELLCSIS